MITAERLSWSYGDAQVLAGVELATRPGRVLGLIGPNGSGKTTLLRLLYGALVAPGGEVRVDGELLGDLSPRETSRRMAVVVQESGGADTAMTVAEMVLLGRTPRLSTFQRARAEDHQVAADCLRRVGGTHLGPRPFAGLSGGERQRVLIARALAQEATHLLLDEPTNHLDIRFQHEVLDLVRTLATAAATTSVIVLHDLNLAARYCDDLVLLGDRGVAASGATRDVLDPDLLRGVYGIDVRRLDLDDEVHLLFRPLPAVGVHTGPDAETRTR